MFKVDKDVPMPREGSMPPGRKPKYPWTSMVIGDSFFSNDAKMKSIASQAWRAGRLLNMKFYCREVDGGVRVWRVE